MFVLALVAGIILGFIFKGNLKNLSNIKFRGIYLIIFGFIIEFIINILITRGIITSSFFTYLADGIMYVLIFIFVFINKENHYILIMGIGFLLNAIAIFTNGGIMPVSEYAIKITGITNNISKAGLYGIIDGQTHFKILCDFIPVRLIGSFVVSIGDVISAIGMMFLIITSMRKEDN